jgi:hypothetical protein
MPRLTFTSDEPEDIRAAWWDQVKGVARSRPPLHKIEVRRVQGRGFDYEYHAHYFEGARLRRVTVQVAASEDWQTILARALEADFQKWLASG